MEDQRTLRYVGREGPQETEGKKKGEEREDQGEKEMMLSSIMASMHFSS